MKSINELNAVINLNEITAFSFEGSSVTVGSPTVFGGQVVAQALNAAYKTIHNNRILHSMHAYFLEAGDLAQDIQYDVAIIRDGGSFSTRRVTAKQQDKIIFILAASFHKIEDGFEHQLPMNKEVTPPEELLSWSDMLQEFGDFLPHKVKEFLQIPRPIEFKPTRVINPMEKKDLPPYSDVWFKLKGDTSGLSLQMKQQILAYISDYNILPAALHPHASHAHFGNVQMASLDHAMWFFRDVSFDDWLLFSVDVPSTSGARGFTRGSIYTRDGKLIASVAQEGLIRPKKKK